MSVLTRPPEVGQVEGELQELRSLYIQEAPRVVLEIGTYFGGTLFEWLTLGSPERVVAVDPNHQSKHLYDNWRHEETNLIVSDAKTQDSVDLITLNAPYDWVFIDGDHEEASVRFDVDLTKSLMAQNGLMLIHDVCWEGDKLAPRVVFEELQKDHPAYVIATARDDFYPENCAHGVGVVRF